MTRSLLLSAACALALGAGSAQAETVHKIPPLNLHAPHWMTDRSSGSIVGTWQVVFDGGIHNAFAQWNKGGTSSEIIDQVPKTGANVQAGSWIKNDDGTVSEFLIGWTWDDKGNNLTGTFTKSETATVSGDSYSGTFEVTFYDLSGNVLFQHDGTMTATRVN